MTVFTAVVVLRVKDIPAGEPEPVREQVPPKLLGRRVAVPAVQAGVLVLVFSRFARSDAPGCALGVFRNGAIAYSKRPFTGLGGPSEPAAAATASAAAAGKVRHFDFETFVIKVAIDLGNGQGQIVDQRLAAHGNGQAFFLDFLRTAQRWQ